MRNSQSQHLATLIRNVLADALFPRKCIGCAATGVWICPHCARGIPLHTEQECFVCRKAKTPSGEPCFACRKKTDLDGVFVAAPFRGSVLAEAIHVFKYEFIDELSEPLGILLANALSHSTLPLPDAILPVPLHPWRFRFRGFNQSLLLARAIACRVIPNADISVLDHILIRRRFTLPQAKTMNAAERRENLFNAFSLSRNTSKDTLREKTFWLVDDVMTTGSTLEECARILKSGGAKKVFGVVLAR